MPREKKQADDPLTGLLSAVLSGHPDVQNHMQKSGQSMDDVLGALMGGSNQNPLGAILGAGNPATSQKSGDPMTDILGALMGSSGVQPGTLGANSFLAPIIDDVARRHGIDPQVAETTVGFVLNQLLSKQGKGADMNDLIQQLTSGQGISAKNLKAGPLATQLAKQTGLDHDPAAKSLEQVLNAFGAHMSGK
jgi:hypothetical protein